MAGSQAYALQTPGGVVPCNGLLSLGCSERDSGASLNLAVSSQHPRSMNLQIGPRECTGRKGILCCPGQLEAYLCSTLERCLGQCRRHSGKILPCRHVLALVRNDLNWFEKVLIVPYRAISYRAQHIPPKIHEVEVHPSLWDLSVAGCGKASVWLFVSI